MLVPKTVRTTRSALVLLWSVKQWCFVHSVDGVTCAAGFSRRLRYPSQVVVAVFVCHANARGSVSRCCCHTAELRASASGRRPPLALSLALLLYLFLSRACYVAAQTTIDPDSSFTSRFAIISALWPEAAYVPIRHRVSDGFCIFARSISHYWTSSQTPANIPCCYVRPKSESCV